MASAVGVEYTEDTEDGVGEGIAGVVSPLPRRKARGSDNGINFCILAELDFGFERVVGWGGGGALLVAIAEGD